MPPLRSSKTSCGKSPFTKLSATATSSANSTAAGREDAEGNDPDGKVAGAALIPVLFLVKLKRGLLYHEIVPLSHRALRLIALIRTSIVLAWVV